MVSNTSNFPFWLKFIFSHPNTITLLIYTLNNHHEKSSRKLYKYHSHSGYYHVWIIMRMFSKDIQPNQENWKTSIFCHGNYVQLMVLVRYSNSLPHCLRRKVVSWKTPTDTTFLANRPSTWWLLGFVPRCCISCKYLHTSPTINAPWLLMVPRSFTTALNLTKYSYLIRYISGINFQETYTEWFLMLSCIHILWKIWLFITYLKL